MDFAEQEKEILKFWEGIGLLEKLREKNKQGKPWSFLDGPITANNPMGVHHAWGRTYKDLFERYKAMQGYNCRFQNGFDCQGLWVEVEVEKELGFKTKKDIESYGIEKFVNKCKERVHKYSKIQTEQSIRLGMLKDWGDWQTDFDEKGEWLKKRHSYYTMSDENNYGIWHFLKECHKQGLLYKGRDVVPWCPRCGTAISQHEILTEEYKELTHKAVFVKFPVREGQTFPQNGKVCPSPTSFLVWTTTPWTLPGNVALAVHPDFEYAIANEKSQSKIKNGKKIILLNNKVDLLGDDYEVVKIVKGKELEGLEYEGIFDDLSVIVEQGGTKVGLSHKVILWKDITQEEGTGIVHIAPGCGAEDYQLSKDLGLSVIDLTDNESNYRKGFGELSGTFVGSEEVREWIFHNLKDKGLVFKIEDYKHRYPTCWRCKNELIFRLVDEWYIKMDTLREPLKKAVEKINWIPGFCKEREIDWLNNMSDWLISKKRYWGLALPIWQCEKCGGFEVIGSKEELKEKAIAGFDKFEGHSPHRPWVDGVKIKCPKCGLPMERIPDVGNPWLDAGIVPFSTLSDDNRAENIPYFQNTEQARQEWQKWFPVELVCESFPGQFKNWFYVLLVMSQVLEGKPPFKNLLGFASVVDEKGEEMHKSKGNAIWFDEAVEKIGADVMRWMYCSQNPTNNLRFGYNVAKETQRKILTLWNCFEFYRTYRTYRTDRTDRTTLDTWIISRLNNTIKTTTLCLDNFDTAKAAEAIEDFWINDLSLWYVRRSRKRFDEAQGTIYNVLLTIAKLIVPTMPFLSEQMYQSLKTEQDPVSVHLCDWPKADDGAIDERLEKEMQTARDIASLGLAARAQANIGARQVLNKLKIKNEKLKTIIQNEKLKELIKEEINVKEVIFDESIESEAELDTTITKDLKEEGILREIIRHIQDMRKKAGLTSKDIVNLQFACEEKLAQIINKNQEQIAETAKLKSLQNNPAKQGEFLIQKEVKIDEVNLWLGIEKK